MHIFLGKIHLVPSIVLGCILDFILRMVLGYFSANSISLKTDPLDTRDAAAIIHSSRNPKPLGQKLQSTAFSMAAA